MVSLLMCVSYAAQLVLYSYDIQGTDGWENSSDCEWHLQLQESKQLYTLWRYKYKLFSFKHAGQRISTPPNVKDYSTQ